MSVTGGDDDRYEVKFAAYAVQYPMLRQWIRMHPEAFGVAYPDRNINNVYFDTWDYRAYAENLAGVSDRSKLRYRWYGDSAGPGVGVLELKLKRNRFGTKERYDVDEAPWEPGLDWLQIRERIRQQVSFAGRLHLDQNPLPVMLNRYVRQYFCSANGKVRMTVDREQRHYDQRLGRFPNFSQLAIRPDSLVLEVKFARTSRREAEVILRDVPFRVTRHSKYMNAVRAISFARM